MTLALLTKTSILPHARTTESITRLHPASSLMSWGKRRHWPPEAVTRDLAASASRCSSGRYTIATYQPIMREMIRIDHEGRLTSAPSMAYIAATALPIPESPPVTIVFLPCIFPAALYHEKSLSPITSPVSAGVLQLWVDVLTLLHGRRSGLPLHVILNSHSSTLLRFSRVVFRLSESALLGGAGWVLQRQYMSASSSLLHLLE